MERPGIGPVDASFLNLPHKLLFREPDSNIMVHLERYTNTACSYLAQLLAPLAEVLGTLTSVLFTGPIFTALKHPCLKIFPLCLSLPSTSHRAEDIAVCVCLCVCMRARACVCVYARAYTCVHMCVCECFPDCLPSVSYSECAGHCNIKQEFLVA